ncbi:MAG: MlaD family protein [Bacteroidota bacterium]|jgi:phospholipid/cholesterol/gamma-HCH transport system substrate-binding protein
MQISNETKVGALTIIAVTFLVLGYNFLRGKSVINNKSNVIYAKFADIGTLDISNPVKIKGYRIGNVSDINGTDENISEVVIAINLKTKVNIPKNSKAVIINSLTGVSTVSIIPGNDPNFLRSGDTLLSEPNPDLMSKVMTGLDPVLISMKATVDTLRNVLHGINNVLSPNTQNDLKATIENVRISSKNLSVLLDSESGSFAKTLNNTAQFTENLNKNNAEIHSIISHLNTTSHNLSQTKFKEAVDTLNQTLSSLQTVLNKLKDKDGTMGLLLNDPALYNQLEQTGRSLHILLDDLKTNPKRYVHFSLFGKKDKSKPLSAPLSDSARKQ